MKQSISEKKEYFSKLYDESFDYVYSYVYTRTAGNRGLTEEIAQETFASAWQALDGYKNKSSFSTWVCSIAKNKLREHYRKEMSRKKHEYSGVEAERMEEGANIEKEILAKETREAVLKTLNIISPVYRYALVLKYIDGLSVKEIAKIAGRTPKAIDGVLQRAKTAFAKTYSIQKARGDKYEKH